MLIGLCDRTERPFQNQNKGIFRPDKKAAYLLLGVPLFFLLKESAGNSTATLCMMMVMLPFFLLAMYEKNGQPLEVILKQMIETKFIRPKNRPYQTNNFYEALARQRDLEMEVKRIVQNRKNGGKGKTHRQREKGRG